MASDEAANFVLERGREVYRELQEARAENDRLRAVVVDMLAGLEYLRTTGRVPYGFGIDRLERTGKAALVPIGAPLRTSMTAQSEPKGAGLS